MPLVLYPKRGRLRARDCEVHALSFFWGFELGTIFEVRFARFWFLNFYFFGARFGLLLEHLLSGCWFLFGGTMTEDLNHGEQQATQTAIEDTKDISCESIRVSFGHPRACRMTLI